MKFDCEIDIICCNFRVFVQKTRYRNLPSDQLLSVFKVSLAVLIRTSILNTCSFKLETI